MVVEAAMEGHMADLEAKNSYQLDRRIIQASASLGRAGSEERAGTAVWYTG